MKNKSFKLLLILFLFLVSILSYNHFKVEVDEEISKTESVILEKNINEYIDDMNENSKDQKLKVVSYKKVKDTNGVLYTRYDMQIENVDGAKSKIFCIYKKE